ncbi:MAG: ATP-binding cassette domain-containing protein [Alphaproteobacteria bacterium]
MLQPRADRPLIAAENVSVAFGGARLLDRVSMAVHPREIITLIGPNGSGKTTLVRTLLGLTRASEGLVIRNAARIGYVPQSFMRDRSLPLTAARFVAGFDGAGDGETREALARAGVAGAAERQLSSLSGGEFARVALARAIMRKPDLLVLDEPLSGVDVAGEASLYELIARMRDETGCGVLLVSHDLHVVMASADRVVCLNRHVCCEGDANAVLRDPAFVQLFGPRVAEQLALYTHRHDHVHTGQVIGQEQAQDEHLHG